MKIRQAIVLATTSIVAVGALGGITGVGTASAATPTFLCTYSAQGSSSSVCAYAQRSNPVKMIAPIPSTTRWTYPANGHWGRIEQANTSLCMQVDPGHGYAVIEATCNASASQQWINHYYAQAKRTTFWSNLGALCLSYDKRDQILKADPSVLGWYQFFASS